MEWDASDAERVEPMMMIEAMANNGGPDKGSDRSNDEDGRTGLVTKTRPKTKRPHLYKVLLLNEDRKSVV